MEGKKPRASKTGSPYPTGEAVLPALGGGCEPKWAKGNVVRRKGAPTMWERLLLDRRPFRKEGGGPRDHDRKGKKKCLALGREYHT